MITYVAYIDKHMSTLTYNGSTFHIMTHLKHNSQSSINPYPEEYNATQDYVTRNANFYPTSMVNPGPKVK